MGSTLVYTASNLAALVAARVSGKASFIITIIFIHQNGTNT